MSDSSLIDRIRNGDGSAWREIVEKHQETMFRIAYLILGDPEEAEDVTQESFIRAYQALDLFDSSRPLRPWLLTITTNMAKNRCRSIGRYYRHIMNLIKKGQKELPNIEDRYITQRQSIVLKRAVDRLNSLDQQVIYLRFFMNLSVKETAQVLGIAEGTVKSRLHRAIDRLREVIYTEFPELKEASDGRSTA